ncbi:alpha/beta fold hydrolase [Brevibacillus humidisoli]|uniref:thioesterase II family protein n=1 Tax=Brevibacillus humidisoli TaxID=2895522 RepID=UPI001E4A7D87|nr:alpha/beta fold hydrolase [Brevibacillus humidisoli]UFJ41778.1 alpha/beta fold hydrolase [Brevibacillus humidisoli]
MHLSKEFSWFVSQQSKQPPKLRLFCFPYAGGGSAVYQGWQEELPPEIQLLAAQLPGREKRFTEPACHSLDELIAGLSKAIIPYLDTPVAFFGHSMGALIAYELARELAERYDTHPVHLFVSAKAAPQIAQTEPPVYNLPHQAFIQKLYTLNGTPKEVLENQELMELYEPILRADFEVCDTYCFRPGLRLDCPISIFGGLQDGEIPVADLAAWEELVARSGTVRMYEGDHFFLHKRYKEIVQMIVKDLSVSIGVRR